MPYSHSCRRDKSYCRSGQNGCCDNGLKWIVKYSDENDGPIISSSCVTSSLQLVSDSLDINIEQTPALNAIVNLEVPEKYFFNVTSLNQQQIIGESGFLEINRSNIFNGFTTIDINTLKVDNTGIYNLNAYINPRTLNDDSIVYKFNIEINGNIVKSVQTHTSTPLIGSYLDSSVGWAGNLKENDEIKISYTRETGTGNHELNADNFNFTCISI